MLLCALKKLSGVNKSRACSDLAAEEGCICVPVDMGEDLSFIIMEI